MKSLCTLTHAVGSNRAAFQRYYEDRHAPFAAGLLPFAGYARHHLLDAPGIGFDTISEFLVPDRPALGALMAGEAGELLRADEEKFLDRTQIVMARVDEARLSPGALADAAGLRTAVLIAPDADAGKARAWAEQLAARHAGVMLDSVQAGADSRFPASAVLWLAGDVAVGAAPDGAAAVRLLVRRCETVLAAPQP